MITHKPVWELVRQDQVFKRIILRKIYAEVIYYLEANGRLLDFSLLFENLYDKLKCFSRTELLYYRNEAILLDHLEVENIIDQA